MRHWRYSSGHFRVLHRPMEGTTKLLSKESNTTGMTGHIARSINPQLNRLSTYEEKKESHPTSSIILEEAKSNVPFISLKMQFLESWWSDEIIVTFVTGVFWTLDHLCFPISLFELPNISDMDAANIACHEADLTHAICFIINNDTSLAKLKSFL